MSPRPHHRTALASTIASIFAAIVCGTSAHAAVIYSESFDYGVSDGTLVGQNGGTGFTGDWTEGNSGITYSAAGLTFSDLSVSGGKVSATGTDGFGSVVSRSFTNPLREGYYGLFLSQLVNTSALSVASGLAFGPQDNDPGSRGILAPYNGNALQVNTKDSNLSSLPNGSTFIQGGSFLSQIVRTTQFSVISPAPRTEVAFPLLPAPKNRRHVGKNSPQFAVFETAWKFYGVDLGGMPGISAGVPCAPISEVGTRDQLLTAFPTPERFASWMGLCPDNRISGDKVFKARKRKVKSRLAAVMRLGVFGLDKSQTQMGT